MRGLGGTDVLEHGLVAGERLSGPVLGDLAEEPVLDGIPLGGAGGIVGDGDAEAEGIAEFLLEGTLPGANSVSVAAAAVWLSPELSSRGTGPRYASTSCARRKRPTSSRVATKAVAVTGPMLGTVRRRWTRASWAARCSMAWSEYASWALRWRMIASRGASVESSRPGSVTAATPCTHASALPEGTREPCWRRRARIREIERICVRTTASRTVRRPRTWHWGSESRWAQR